MAIFYKLSCWKERTDDKWGDNKRKSANLTTTATWIVIITKQSMTIQTNNSNNCWRNFSKKKCFQTDKKKSILLHHCIVSAPMSFMKNVFIIFFFYENDFPIYFHYLTSFRAAEKNSIQLHIFICEEKVNIFHSNCCCFCLSSIFFSRVVNWKFLHMKFAAPDKNGEKATNVRRVIYVMSNTMS